MCSKRWAMPVMPGRSLAEPTCATQPHDTVGDRCRGTSSTFMPFASTCSSTVGAVSRAAGARPVVAAACAASGTRASARHTAARPCAAADQRRRWIRGRVMASSLRRTGGSRYSAGDRKSAKVRPARSPASSVRSRRPAGPRPAPYRAPDGRGGAAMGAREERNDPEWTGSPDHDPAVTPHPHPHPHLELPESTKNFRFPAGFLWGAATSAHQVEGNNIHNDWWLWEQAGKTADPSGAACEHYERYRSDFDLAQSISHNAHRFSIEWSRIEPEEGRWSSEALDHYRDVLVALHERGLEPVV